MTADRPTLRVENLRIGFESLSGIRIVLSDLSLQLHPRDRVALIGESGSGKTVTALAVCGLLESHPGLIGGSVDLEGRALYGRLAAICREDSTGGAIQVRKDRLEFERILREHVRPLAQKGISLIFQEAKETLDPLRTVGAQMVETLRRSRPGVGDEGLLAEAKGTLKSLGFLPIDAIVEKYPHELSGGMAQRVGVALALACHPKLLIADEPTSALDAILQKQVADLLLELHDGGDWALLLITHNLRLARYIADTIIVLYRGCVVEAIPSDALEEKDRSLHPYTEALRDAAETLTGVARPDRTGTEGRRRARGSPMPPGHRPAPGGCPFASLCPGRERLPGALRDRCDQELPPFRNLDPEGRHWVRCWLFETGRS